MFSVILIFNIYVLLGTSFGSTLMGPPALATDMRSSIVLSSGILNTFCDFVHLVLQMQVCELE